jgi:hypothetical protein
MNKALPLLTIFFLSLFSTCFAQSETELDSIYLQNGQMLRGYIHKLVMDDYLLFESLTNELINLGEGEEKIKVHVFAGGQISLPMEYIKSIIEHQIPNTPIFSTKHLDTKGVYGITSLGISIGNGTELQTRFSSGRHFNFVLGYQLSSHFLIGVGAGSDLHEIDRITELAFTPIYLDLRYFVLKKAFTPYISLGIGYSLGNTEAKSIVQSHYSNGWMINPRVGLKLTPKWLEGIFLYTGYKIQYTTFERENQSQRGNYTLSQKLLLRRFEMGLGFVF